MGNLNLLQKGNPMFAAIQATSPGLENWKSNFLSFISNRLDQIEKNDSMES